VIAPNVRLIAGVVVGFATVPDTPFTVVTETAVTVPEPPPIAAHPVAFPLARTPVGAFPVEQSVGVAASAVAVAALPLVLFVIAPTASTSDAVRVTAPVRVLKLDTPLDTDVTACQSLGEDAGVFPILLLMSDT
jgi:hypothetical protein